MADKRLYVITCVDDQSCGPADPPAEPRSGSAKRIGIYAEHKAYQASTADPDSPNFITKITAGPMVTDDGKYMVGSSFIVEGTREQVEAFYKNDPFYKAGVWASITCEQYFSVQGIQARPPSSL
ncbi:YCII-related [Tribonema minus]|uniref:YCII-related n=1 Tax=Tribonema minus TaxID=303371 RepID=A0A835Z4J4_9STRA|nr:YCII-related [Tribonema minus]